MVTTSMQLIDDNEVTNSKIKLIHSVSGIKKKVLFFIVGLCSEDGCLITSPINCREMSLRINEKYNSTKQAISRLKKDGLIKSIKNKDGRGGFACFQISETVKQHVVELQKKYAKINSTLTATEDELKQAGLSDWLKNITEDELLKKFYDKEVLEKIGSDQKQKILALKIAEENASKYFMQEIWPSVLAYRLKHTEESVTL